MSRYFEQQEDRAIFLQWTCDWPELLCHASWPGAASCWRMVDLVFQQDGTLAQYARYVQSFLDDSPLLFGKARNLQMVRAFPEFDTSRHLSLGVSQRPNLPSPPTKCGGFTDADHGRVKCNLQRHDLSCMSISPRDASLAKENTQNGTKVRVPSQNLCQSVELIEWIKLSSLHQSDILYLWSARGDKSW